MLRYISSLRLSSFSSKLENDVLGLMERKSFELMCLPRNGLRVILDLF